MQNIFYWIKNNVKDLIICFLILVSMGMSAYVLYSNNKPIKDEEEIFIAKNSDIKETEGNTLINIDIKGAVKNPGVYQVSNNAIVNDIVALAGGFTSSAYKNGINLSKKVTDETVIYVYTKTEIKSKKDAEKVDDTLKEVCNAPSYDICDCVENKTSIIESSPNDKENNSENKNETPDSKLPEKQDKVNINLADINALTSLSGIGESKAQAIIEYRKINGPFKAIEELTKVSGIGDALFEKVKDSITI